MEAVRDRAPPQPRSRSRNRSWNRSRCRSRSKAGEQERGWGGQEAGAHACRCRSSGGRSHPVYAPLVILYSSNAPKQGSCGDTGFRVGRADSPPPLPGPPPQGGPVPGWQLTLTRT